TYPGAYLPQGKQGICLGRHFSGGAALPPGRREGRRDTRGMGTRWDPRETAGCMMVYAEPDSCSRGWLEL
ncbi:unnamed protein product, partial [Staurois parvus]